MSRDPEKMNHPPPGSGADPLADSLARLEPSPVFRNRDRLMFAAGADSRRSVIRLWQLTAGVMAAAGFFTGMFYGESKRVVRDHTPTTPITGLPSEIDPGARQTNRVSPVSRADSEETPAPHRQSTGPVQPHSDTPDPDR